MSRMNHEDIKIHRGWFKTAIKGDLMNIAISGPFSIPADAPFILKVDPTGAQNVTCPTKGSRFIHLIMHGSSNNVDLTIKDSTAATIGTLSQNEIGMIIDDGVATRFGMMPQT